jgi:hypothetical protein
MSAPFNEDGVGSMMASLESFRSHIEQNARLIDKQTSDEEMQEISQGQQGSYPSSWLGTDLITIQPS